MNPDLQVKYLRDTVLRLKLSEGERVALNNRSENVKRTGRTASWTTAVMAIMGVALLWPAAPAVGQTAPADEGQEAPDMEIAAIYFPSWHPDDHYSAWFGEGWNEWKLVEEAEPRFDEHQLLKPTPEWGYFDEADPKWAEKQIDLATEHGVDVFIFDWYWYSGVKFIEGALEKGFLQASNREDMKFALMWANHTWGNYFPVPYDGPFHWLLPIRHSQADFERVMQYCIDNYFNQPNHWRVDGGLYFSIFAPEEFVKQLGGPEKAKQVFDAARKQVRDAGLGEMHFAAFTGIPQSVESMEAAGFDSMTSYNVTTMSSGLQLPENPIETYESMMERHESYWDNMDSGGLPYAPVVTVGWDVSYRWETDIPWPPEKNHYPYTPIITGNTPEKFGQLVQNARRHAAASENNPPFILINAWNEWTEGSALLPNTVYGNGYLEELQKALETPVESSQ
jgi:hypothetical protein